MRKPHTKTIKGVKYTVPDLPALTAWEMLMDVTKTIGPAGASVFFGGSAMLAAAKRGEDTDLVASVKALCEGLDKAFVLRAMKELAEDALFVDEDGTEKPLKGATFDRHFRGRMGSLMEWFWFAFSSQYDDFFDTLRSAIGNLPAETAPSPE